MNPKIKDKMIPKPSLLSAPASRAPGRSGFKKTAWTTQDSAKVYGVPIWSGGYFTVNKKGRVEAAPKGPNGPRLDLYKIITEMKGQNARLPLLIRFPDIVHSQMAKLASCFNQAIEEYGYKGSYQGVFPIKVNQQSYVVNDIIRAKSQPPFGLEVGSKPELLIALALAGSPERIIICNGFKDEGYIQTALLSSKTGQKIFIVVERLEELSVILNMAAGLNAQPRIGFRIKLNTQGGGRWMNSSGSRSKFGLTASDIVQGLKLLKKHDCAGCLKLLHFHLGSQVASIQPIKSAIREAGRIVTELYKSHQVKIDYLDVGGGLGVDYDGSGDSDSSTNYSSQEYANDIVYHLQNVCSAEGAPHPHIISESGRFITAHSSLLIFNITGANQMERPGPAFAPGGKNILPPPRKAHSFVKDLYDIYKGLNQSAVSESFNDLMEKKKDIHQLFAYGVLNLKEVACAENIYYTAASRLKMMTEGKEDYEDIFQFLASELADVYFSNFSVFQSLPDSWALGHVFPVMPVHRLQEQPMRRARLADLTCDSDGKISYFMNYEHWKNEKHLFVHHLKPGQAYYMAVFLTGAYQEILGDMHNLFGDTDTLHISAGQNGGYLVDHQVEGDSVYDMLKYVGYHKRDLMEKMQKTTEQAVARGRLSRGEAGHLLKNYSHVLTSYTYLS